MSDMLSAVDPDLRHAAVSTVQRLQDAGHRALWAGGSVRDLLRGRPPKDIDIATDAPPGQVLALFPGSLAIGKAFGVVLVRHGGIDLEVATFRRDLGYEDGRRPTAVSFTSAEEDARRRDFTINGMFYDPVADQVLDYVGGQDDLRAGVIRAIGDASARFAEDHLRLMRAVRFAAVLEFDIDPATAEAAKTAAPLLARISAERIRQEFTRMLVEAPRPSRAMRLMSELRLLPVVLPEVEAMRGVEQPPEYHPEGDVFEHTLMMLDELRERTPAHVFAVLLHDVGKPPTFRISVEPDGRERIRFDGHDRVGAEMAESILRRLRCSNELIDQVVRAVRQHMRFMHVQEMRSGKLRQMVGAPTFPLELELHRVDCLSSHRKLDNFEFLVDFQRKLAAEPALPRPLVSGHDLIAAGMAPGRTLGQSLRLAYDAQLEGRFTDREGGLAWLRERLAQDDTAAPGSA